MAERFDEKRNEVADGVKTATSKAADTVQEAASRGYKAAEDAASRGYKAASDVAERGYDRAREIVASAPSLSDQIAAQPILAVTVAAAVGGVVGWILRGAADD